MIVNKTKNNFERKLIEKIYGNKPNKIGAFAILLPTTESAEHDLDKYQLQKILITENIIPDAKSKTITQTVKEIAYFLIKENNTESIIMILKPSEDPFIHYYQIKNNEINEIENYKEVVF